jgi:[protein-PII] uridylyltransferase
MSKTRTSYPSRLDVFKVPPRVFIENKVSTNHTVIEVGGRDRIGFLYTVTHILSEMGLTISTAHISTYGERAVDVFYVKDVFGLKINHEGKIREIRERIIEALSQTPEKLKKTG